SQSNELYKKLYLIFTYGFYNQISHAIKQYIKLGYKLESGNDIKAAISNIAGTRVANIMLNRDFVDDDNIRSIYARALPGIRNWKVWSSTQIEKIAKKRKLEKLNPIYTSHSYSCKAWMTPIVGRQGINNIAKFIFICERSFNIALLEMLPVACKNENL
ncbi:4199_t:CDS:2, partial [Racocetra fulgida]